MPTILSLVSSLVGLFLFRLLLGLRMVARNVGNLSGPFFLFSPDSVLGEIIMRIARPAPYLNMGKSWAFRRKYKDFVAAGQDAAALITAFPRPKCAILLADAGAIKEVTTSRAKFPKPADLYAGLTMFGPNIIASEGEEWKKYRKVIAPAFSERNNKLVWDITTQIMVDLFDNVWDDRSEIVVDHCVDITLPIALYVIGVAGFGRQVTWADDLAVPPEHQMTFKDSLRTLSTNLFLKIMLPSWANNTTKHTRKVNQAFNELKQYMVEMVEARKTSNDAEEHHNLFSGLLNASQEELDNGAALSAEEVIGNMFILNLAGHETTAYALCFSFGLLALFPDEQERLYQNINDVISNLNRTPTYEDMGRFTYSLAVFYETLRLFPLAPYIPKRAMGDTTLTVSNAEGGKTTFPVPSGTDIYIHIPGLHYNPRYWKDPHKFMPERFLGNWPKDAFIPFGQGALACLGRQFSETEGIAAMTMLVSKYRIEVKEEPEFANETFEERYARIMDFDVGLTPCPVRMPLVFRRR